MTAQLSAVCFAADDPSALARFWSGLLGWSVASDGNVVELRPTDDTGFRFRFRPTTEPKRIKNQTHFDLTSESLEDQQQTVRRALELGARPVDVGQRPDERHIVLADPEGNEFCVIEPGNNFLAGCGFLGAVVCDGSQAVGYFWSAALGWPLVWDQDEETAIQSPRGGPKITWGGWAFAKDGPNRLHLELDSRDGDRDAALNRLLALGATRLGSDLDEPGRVLLADPDGNEFCLG